MKCITYGIVIVLAIAGADAAFGDIGSASRTSLAPQHDLTLAVKRTVQDLTSQHAVALVRERKLTTGREALLFAQLDQQDKALRVAAKTSNEARNKLDQIISERDALVRKIAERDRDVDLQIASYESAIKNIALSEDPKVVAYLDKFVVGDRTSVDEFVRYTTSQYEIRDRVNKVQYAEQIRVAAAQKDVLRLRGEATLDEVMALYEKAYSLDPVNIQGGLRLGMLKAMVGEREKAAAIYRALIPYAKNPRERLALLGYLGDALQNSDPKKALGYYRETLGLARKIAAEKPNDFRELRNIGVALEKIAILLEFTDPDAALANYNESLDLARKLASQQPDDIFALRDLGISLSNLGDVLLNANPAQAAKYYQESLGISRDLAARNPKDIQIQQDLSMVLLKIAEVQEGSSSKKAQASCRESLDISRKLALKEPNNVDVQRLLAMSLSALAGTMVANDSAKARSLYQESLQIGRGIAARDPMDMQALRDISADLQHLGMLMIDSDQAKALTLFKESLDISRRLLALDAKNYLAQSNVASNLDRVGSMLAETAPAQALIYFRECIEIDRSLASRRPSDISQQRDLWVILRKAAILTDQKADWRAALSQADKMKASGQWQPEDEASYRDAVLALKEAEPGRR